MQGPVRSADLQELQSLVGCEIGVSEWTRLTQDRIDQFAAVTDDHQPIHVNPVGAAGTQWGGTIAHGFLVLALIGNFSYQIVPRIRGTDATLNYGLNRVRFVAPVPSGSRIRGRFSLVRIERRSEVATNMTYNVVVEIEGVDRPALVAEWIVTSVFR